MDGDTGRTLIGMLADVVTDEDPVSSARVTARLAGLGGAEWLRLDESARRPYWGQRPLDDIAEWQPVLTAGGGAITTAIGAVIAASMARDGRVRENAVAALSQLEGPVAAAALAVRVADWVPEVSTVAMAAVVARPVLPDAAAIVSVFLALRERRRGRRASGEYLASLATGPAAILESLSADGGRDRRLWALEALAQRSLLTADGLAARAMRDRDPVVALWCARHLVAPSGELPPAVGVPLLKSVRAGVRAFATGQLADDQLDRETLRRLLLDRSGAVRSMARWRWRQHYGDPGPVYRLMLTAGGRPRQIAAALQGLDEDHGDDLPAAAVPFLAHPSPAVRYAATQAVGRYGGTSDAVTLLVPLLSDSSSKVAAAALRYLHGMTLPASVLASLDGGTPRSRRIALSIRQHLDTWDRVHADLAAINGPDPDLAEMGRTDLLTWLQHGAANSYGQPDASRAVQIARLLGSRRLTDTQRREIAFVAGIGLPAAAPPS